MVQLGSLTGANSRDDGAVPIMAILMGGGGATVGIIVGFSVVLPTTGGGDWISTNLETGTSPVPFNLGGRPFFFSNSVFVGVSFA